jgi:hypothetical protein
MLASRGDLGLTGELARLDAEWPGLGCLLLGSHDAGNRERSPGWGRTSVGIVDCSLGERKCLDVAIGARYEVESCWRTRFCYLEPRHARREADMGSFCWQQDRFFRDSRLVLGGAAEGC